MNQPWYLSKRIWGLLIQSVLGIVVTYVGATQSQPVIAALGGASGITGIVTVIIHCVTGQTVTDDTSTPSA